MEVLRSGDAIDYEQLGDVFGAFGFTSEVPDFVTEVYYHKRWEQCGMFTARDYGMQTLSPGQRQMVCDMVDCVRFCEEYDTTTR